MNGEPTQQRLLTQLPEWRALHAHYAEMQSLSLRQLFAGDLRRGETFIAEAAGLYLDYSKHRVTQETLKLLIALAEARGLRGRIEAMFRGEKINRTENRAVLHVALRAPKGVHMQVDGRDVVPEVHAMLERMSRFSERLRSGSWRGHSGKRIRHVINIGLGGSDLGPEMACEALRHCSQRDLDLRFVSNADGTAFAEAVRNLSPEETLFIVCSKTFTTAETLSNARLARAWCLEALGDEQSIQRHFVAVTANAKAAVEFGMAENNLFDMWDWIGGRYSMDSAIGLSLMIAIGADHFQAMLGGFRAMDEHFSSTPFERNLPVIMGLLSVWYVNFFNVGTWAVLPYDEYLKYFPAYLQQLAMESNGKHVTQDGMGLDYQSSPIVWGERGTNGQHSFYQLLHQGTRLVPCDFIGFCRSLNPLSNQHALLMANMFAQSEALAFGRDAQQLRKAGVPQQQIPYRVCDGNRPSSTILCESLTPAILGALVALYEHSVFTQGVIWDLNSFDQWGVELGKLLAGNLLPELEQSSEPTLGHDSSTNALIRRYRRFRQSPARTG
ncbi:MAG: glucose-6-phosphate isomerase [Gammaproteobacteria bacterium]|nr:glucose-6-phosphate isomerase [Gammaproteobacteria bacterium]